MVLLASASVLLTSSCSSYLDIVPDERAQEDDVVKDRNKNWDYMYSCYAYLPNPSNTQSLDLLTGDEVITAFEHEKWAAFPKGTYNSTEPVISYWNTFFQGIRQCYMMQRKINEMQVDEETKKDYRGQIDFLLAYYHYLLVRCYGPVILVKSLPDVNTKVEDYAARTPLDECVQWIADKFDEAAKNLPATREQRRVGLATSTAAKGLKAQLLLLAASPLFNGEAEFLKDLKNPDGKLLMPQAKDPQKWIKAKDALKEAISAAEAAGHSLYTKTGQFVSLNKFPKNAQQRTLRYNILDWTGEANPEVIFADTRGEGWYDLAGKSSPKGEGGSGWNGVAPTWNMLNRFYTKNGLPWDEDPEFKDQSKLELVTVDATQSEEAMPGKQTIKFNLGREPRFYAWIGFQGGYYEILNKDKSNPAFPKTYLANGEEGNVLLDFMKNGNQGRGNRNNNYSPTGYLNKKGVYPEEGVGKGGVDFTLKHHPWPVLRLADLYLAYAEACVEAGDNATALTYLNKVRVRAGIPTAEESWKLAGVTSFSQAKLRQIVRQERQVEFYLENQNFWDMRRWLEAEKYFSVKAQGMNIQATTIADFAHLTEVPFERAFGKHNYLLPIPVADVNRNGNLVNNPGY